MVSIHVNVKCMLFLGFEYESEFESESGYGSQTVKIENKYYEAEDYKSSNPEKSAGILNQILKEFTFDETTMHWRFKCLIQLVLLSFRLSLHESFSTYLDEALNTLERVSRPEAVDGLTILLEGLNSSHQSLHEDARIELFERIISRLGHMKSHRLWLTLSLQLARMYLSQVDNEPALRDLLTQMHAVADSSSFRLDVYAIEISLITRVWKGPPTVRALTSILADCPLEGAVGNPGAIATIREATGKMYLAQSLYQEAYSEFFEAFRSFSDSGDLKAPQVLQYAVVANILSSSSINPFDSREARAYLSHPQVSLMRDVRRVYESNRINLPACPSDPFIAIFWNDIKFAMQTKMVKNIAKVYSLVNIDRVRELTQTTDPVRLLMQVIEPRSRIENGYLVTKDVAMELREARAIRDYALLVKNKLTTVR